jgi:hypothetical protein
MPWLPCDDGSTSQRAATYHPSIPIYHYDLKTDAQRQKAFIDPRDGSPMLAPSLSAGMMTDKSSSL